MADPVLLTVSETITGAEFSDTLADGGSPNAGLDLGQVVNGSYAPVIDSSFNTGRQEIFVRHDASVDPITNLAFHVETFSGSYGGADTAGNDITTLTGYGAADAGATANNSDGASRGLRIDMDWQVTSTNQFSYAREGTGQMRIFGKTYGTSPNDKDGASQAKAFTAYADAMSYWNGATEVDATTPEDGKVGKSDDTVLGNRLHMMKRFALHQGATVGGILQWDMVLSYSYTA